MDKQIIERAVEAAAKADYEVLRRGRWDEQPGDFRDEWRGDVRPMVTAALAEVEASLTAERDRLAKRIDTLLGVADEDGITYSPKESQRAMRRYAAFEYDNLVAERDDLAARVARVGALLPDADDPYVHVHPLPGGEPDCGGCWDADIRQAIRGESCLSLHRTEAGWPDCSTCGGGCPDCTDQS